MPDAEPSVPVSPDAPDAPEPAPPEADEPVWIEGTLLGPDGGPVAGAPVRLGPRPDRETVEAWKQSGTAHRDLVFVGSRVLVHGEVVTRTDDTGRFAVPPPAEPGLYDLHLGGLLEIVVGREALEFRPGDYLNLGVVTLPARGAIFGAVRDESARPVTSVPVRAWRTDLGVAFTELGMEGDPKLRMNGRIAVKQGRAGPTAWTDERGDFEFPSLPPGRWAVGFVSRSSEEVTLPSGGRAGPVVLRVPSPRPPILAGRVVDAETGEPRPCAYRYLAEGVRIDGESARGGSFRIVTAPDGTFRLSGLRPGEYTIEVFPEGGEPVSSGPHVLADGQSITGIEIRVPHGE